MHDDIEHDEPIPLPAAAKLAERCMSRAWDDGTDDESRLLLEQAALMLRRLMPRCVAVAQVNEGHEADG